MVNSFSHTHMIPGIRTWDRLVPLRMDIVFLCVSVRCAAVTFCQPLVCDPKGWSASEGWSAGYSVGPATAKGQLWNFETHLVHMSLCLDEYHWISKMSKILVWEVDDHFSRWSHLGKVAEHLEMVVVGLGSWLMTSHCCKCLKLVSEYWINTRAHSTFPKYGTCKWLKSGW